MKKALITAIIMMFFLTGCGKKDAWIITQYDDKSGNQGTFYTIHNDAKDILICIDGGWEANATQVREVIKQHGNHVNAWYVSHYHNDHVDAVNAILDEPGKIQIDQIYDIPMDYDYYMANSFEWDFTESYDKYLEVTAGMDNITHVSRGDIYEYPGLKIEVLNTFDDDTREIHDFPNNSSMCLKVSGATESMLFMSDTHNTETMNAIAYYFQDRLDSDYIQPGHHGNNTMPLYFYEIVSPKLILFDTPESFINNEKLRYKELVAWCEENGVDYVYFNSAPNSIELK